MSRIDEFEARRIFMTINGRREEVWPCGCGSFIYFRNGYQSHVPNPHQQKEQG